MEQVFGNHFIPIDEIQEACEYKQLTSHLDDELVEERDVRVVSETDKDESVTEGGVCLPELPLESNHELAVLPVPKESSKPNPCSSTQHQDPEMVMTRSMSIASISDEDSTPPRLETDAPLTADCQGLLLELLSGFDCELQRMLPMLPDDGFVGLDSSCAGLPDLQHNPCKDSITVPVARREKEAATRGAYKDQQPYVKSDVDVFELTNVDVLFGRGRGSNRHAGNIAWLAQKCCLKASYRSARKKKAIATQLMEWVFNRGGRFLEPCRVDGKLHHYKEIRSTDRILRKASQTLRED